MKQREDAKHERRNGIPSQSFPIIAALRTADFHRVWLPEPAAADRPREIHCVVSVSLSLDRRGNWMGDVSVLALKERPFRGRIDSNFLRMPPDPIVVRTGRGSSVVEQPIRNRSCAQRSKTFPNFA